MRGLRGLWPLHIYTVHSICFVRLYSQNSVPLVPGSSSAHQKPVDQHGKILPSRLLVLVHVGLADLRFILHFVIL